MNAFINNNKPLPQQAAEYLTQWILESGLTPGDKLPTELELAKTLQVGRSTVREAIMILKSRNIVEVRRGCGTFLSKAPGQIDDPLGLEFVKDRAKLAMDWGIVRLIIEPAVVELAAIHADEEDLRQIAYWNRRIDEDIDEGRPHLESDVAFHRAITAASKNILMDKLMPLISEGIQQFMGSVEEVSTPDARKLHHEIQAAIERHDADAARRAMEAVLCLNQERMRQSAANPPAGGPSAAGSPADGPSAAGSPADDPSAAGS